MAQTRKRRKKKTSHVNEIVGIVLIGFAIFLALTVYFKIDSIAGNVISGFFFGLVGVVGYVLPIILAAVGVLVIISKKKKKNNTKIALLVAMIFCILSLLHVSVSEAIISQHVDFPGYLEESFQVGLQDMAGGGFAGALLCFGVYLLMGAVGSYIIFIVGIVACLIVLTNLSIKKVGADIGSAVKTTVHGYRDRRAERKQQEQLYMEQLMEQERVEFAEMAAMKPSGDFNMQIEEEEAVSEPLEIMRDEVIQDVPFDTQNGAFFLEIEEREAEQQQPPQPNTRVARRKLQAEPEAGQQAERVVPSAPVERAPKRELPPEVPAMVEEPEQQSPLAASSGNGEYVKPPITILKETKPAPPTTSADLKKNIEILEQTFKSFRIEAKVVNVSKGPVVTRYEVQPAPGVKVSRIVSLSDDIALNLSARDVRIEAPVPGKPVVGIEIPNSESAAVGLRELVADPKFQNAKSALTFALGKDISGANVYGDISKMPHMLIAGATGSGKSVCMNSIILSLLYHATPDEIKLIMIDPKMVELNVYNEIPHLLIPVVTDAKKAASAINWAVNEMTLRYRMFAQKKAKELESYNRLIVEEGGTKLPKIVLFIDELADLMMVAPGEVEDAICRIAQLGRASGIHLVIATQRPSVNVITGVIKANIPSRIALSVQSQIDSRTILDMGGAEKLLGNGDMLYYPTGLPKPLRLQGCYVSDKEVEAITSFLKEHSQADYSRDVMDGISNPAAVAGGVQEDRDDLFMRALETVIEYEQASTSMLQRRLRVGYSRAARLVDQLEAEGYISPMDGSKPRQVLISKEEFDAMQNGEAEAGE